MDGIGVTLCTSVGGTGVNVGVDVGNSGVDVGNAGVDVGGSGVDVGRGVSVGTVVPVG